MANRYDYIQIDEKTKPKYGAFLPEAGMSRENDISIGICADKKPCGAVRIHKHDQVLTIRSIRMADAEGEAADLKPVIEALSGYAKKTGYKQIECRYTDDEPRITKQQLGDAGFTAFKEDATVYRTDAYTLGSLLRDGPDAMMMRTYAVRIMREGRVRCFTEAYKESLKMFTNLYPDNELSFMTVDGEENPTGYIVVSTLPDGGLYLADMRCLDGMEEDLLGLLFMCLGKVFMRIEPDGEFYIAAITDNYRRFADYLFAPVKPLISVNRIRNARLDIK